MHLTGTEIVYDDLWSTAVFKRDIDQYTVTYRTDVDESLVGNVWNFLPIEELIVLEQYFDKDLNREVIVLGKDSDGKA